MPSNPKEALALWCLESSGKGRIESGREHHLFNYYGTLKFKPDYYVVALDLPIYGEEVLNLDLKQKIITGNFLKRLPQSKSLSQFFYAWRSWLITKIEGGDISSNFEMDEDRLILSTALTENESVKMTLHELNNDRYFSRQTIDYVNNTTNTRLKLELFTTECRDIVAR